ncbi:Glycolipid 2-alpha-mannosyltransferase 2 [Leucoagaricus sp. SymC.cos]|nr:Glycolipid 2-alpha-mannosyltransferase 2 [Leucoagaricus sp. SymC.cos]
MNTAARYLVVILGLIISIHYILSFTHESYGRATALSNIKNHLYGTPNDDDITTPPNTSPDIATDSDVDQPSTGEHLVIDRRANATFVILCRNSDVDGTIRSIREIEDRFNRKYRYPYVLLNEVPFTEEFKSRIKVLTSAKMEFGLIPHDHWYQPDWIDEERATEGRDKMVANNVIYGGSVSYRNMCRFNSGFFYRHPLMQKYRWYWRIEPDVHFHCDINKDPFLFMEDNNKTYSFTITMYEYEATIPTLWSSVKDFQQKHPQYIAEDNAIGFMSEDGEKYNLCHFWSNFEIADMDFWRGEAYSAFFEFLESKGGFYYERANRETWVWHELRHPNVLEFLGVMRGFGQLRDCPAFVSPYCENGIVTEYLKSHPQADRLEMIRSVASGLSYLHGKKVIHGDFKPTNVLIGPSGNPVICDFGRSEILSHRGFTTGFASSRRYQAPELFLETEKPRPTQASDVYSFAISAFEIWTGIQPYREIPNEDVIAIHVGLQNGRPVCPEDAPPGKEYLWPLLEACWERDKSKRMDMETLMRKM